VFAGGLRSRFAAFWDVPPGQRFIRIAGVAGVVVLVLGVVAWNYLFFGIPKMPPPDQLWSMNRQPAVRFVDEGGRTLASRGPQYGALVKASELPPYVSQAFIAAEDQRFFEHGVVDVQSVTRAVVANVAKGHTAQGGSTLTQQLVKNLLLTDERSLRRKAQEARLAGELEKKLSKQQILDLYLNRVYLGANAYGVDAAAQTYFGNRPKDLTLNEAAFLASLPKAPTRFAEHRTDPDTIARRGYVLDQMVEAGYAKKADADAAKAATLKFADDTPQAGFSGYVMDAALDEAKRAVPNLPPDAVITLTINRDLQRLGASEGAVVVMSPTGEVRAMVGGKDYKKSQFNRATQARRQPGSSFKTFVYAAALEQGMQPSDIRNDEPIQIGNWQPKNYSDTYVGPITLAKALAISSNSVAAQVGSEVGPRRVVELAKRFGISTPLQPNLSLALGTDEVTLMDMTSAYAVLANGGLKPSPHIVTSISNIRGDMLYTAPRTEAAQRVYAESAVETLTGMLSNVVRAGTGHAAGIPGWQIAGKTGTSQSWRDAWFVGYSSRYVGGVWIGNDDDHATKQVTGGGASAALFAKVMTAAHKGVPARPLPGADQGAMWLDSGFDQDLSNPEQGGFSMPVDPADAAYTVGQDEPRIDDRDNEDARDRDDRYDPRNRDDDEDRYRERRRERERERDDRYRDDRYRDDRVYEPPPR
jgi:penicillin-binding protein 1A